DAADDAVSGLDLHVPAGTRLALVGESGAGKSTIAGLVAVLEDAAEQRERRGDLDARVEHSHDRAEQPGLERDEGDERPDAHVA
ncbi:ATP-binding cassette domain-containing protein, partial [Escherichia coli]|uniref:ATP-binding cassette domain-containing protein n=1 Tax=Escherichia coli TaxID=562 RepID=UPI0019333F37